ncbi:hypothetical protein [Neobacillus niacini]|uniref:hypothetical protein n=1 Tax=Neobacillus niacini TaxID=86668 RepID=UPI00286AF15A|nr:hypothetical protein [Neobacillus niacini]
MKRTKNQTDVVNQPVFFRKKLNFGFINGFYQRKNAFYQRNEPFNQRKIIPNQ